MQLKYRRKYTLAMSLVSAGQSIIINHGQIAACFLAIYQVIHKIRSPGDFVILVTYWSQLKGTFS
jgi:ABC-type transport system involved in Fe-S cluster assembly fused permease/ATPase subunit